MAERQEPTVQAETVAPKQLDRRRPGRTENVSPELIPLLRGKPVLPPDDVDDQKDSLTPSLGVLIGVAICSFFWVAVLWLIL
jgi:hypothetical protein